MNFITFHVHKLHKPFAALVVANSILKLERRKLISVLGQKMTTWHVSIVDTKRSMSYKYTIRNFLDVLDFGL